MLQVHLIKHMFSIRFPRISK